MRLFEPVMTVKVSAWQIPIPRSQNEDIFDSHHAKLPQIEGHNFVERMNKSDTLDPLKAYD